MGFKISEELVSSGDSVPCGSQDKAVQDIDGHLLFGMQVYESEQPLLRSLP